MMGRRQQYRQVRRGNPKHSHSENNTNGIVASPVSSQVANPAQISVQTQTSGPISSLPDVIRALSSMRSSTRLDTITQLLYVLNPHEVRYLGSCLECLARKDSQQLRHFELRINDVDVIRTQLESSSDNIFESLAIISSGLTVLYSTNRRAAFVFAKAMYSIIERMDAELNRVSSEKLSDLIELLRLSMIAIKRHPAFLVEHRLKMDAAINRLDHLTTAFEHSNECKSDVQPSKSLQVMSIEVDEPMNDSISQLACHITWTDGSRTNCGRTFSQLRAFHYKLLDSFPLESGCQGVGRRLIPYFPQASRRSESRLCSSTSYLRSLSDLPARILLSSTVATFFAATPDEIVNDASTSVQVGNAASESSEIHSIRSPAVVRSDSSASHADLQVHFSSSSPPVCPNCAQCGHDFAQCTQRSMHEIAATGDFKLEWNDFESIARPVQ